MGAGSSASAPLTKKIESQNEYDHLHHIKALPRLSGLSMLMHHARMLRVGPDHHQTNVLLHGEYWYNCLSKTQNTDWGVQSVTEPFQSACNNKQHKTRNVFNWNHIVCASKWWCSGVIEKNSSFQCVVGYGYYYDII